VEPGERFQVVWGCGTRGERSGCVVGVEPGERDQVVWGCGTRGVLLFARNFA